MTRSQFEARRFLYAVYPELRSLPLSIETTPTARGGVELRVREVLVSPTRDTRDTASRGVLAGEFEFDVQDALLRYRAEGVLLRREENAGLRERLAAAADPDAQLATERVQFRVSTDAMLRSEASLTDVGAALGALTIRTTALRSVARDASSNYGAIWDMAVTARKPGQSDRGYVLTFEPYGGRLVGLSRQ